MIKQVLQIVLFGLFSIHCIQIHGQEWDEHKLLPGSYMDEIRTAITIYGRTDLEGYYQSLVRDTERNSWDSTRIEREIAKKDSLLFTIKKEKANTPDFRIKKRFDIDLVEASFPVDFSQVTAGENHYIAYYDKDKNFCVGYRKLEDSGFNKTILNSKIAWDSHNYAEIIVDNDGYIHVSGNMHNVPLKYWRSKKPYDASEFEEINYMTGREEQRVTYPEFMKTSKGDLLFHYRSGGSGNGFEIYNKWDPQTKTWQRFLDKPLIDGLGERNAYMKGPVFGPDNYYHLYWVWRETPDCATNHNFSYARSKDLQQWENVAGDPVTSPIVFSEDKLKVDPSSKHYGTGMLNGVQGHTFDAENRIVLCNMKYDSLGNSQLYVYRFTGQGRWEEQCITNWVYRFNFSGWGSIVFEIKLLGMQNLGNGKLGVSYYHSKYGTGEIILDENTLKPIAVREIEPDYPVELNEVTTKGAFSKPVQVHINQYGRHILRWETMGASNDRKPAAPFPDDYMMELIELE
ncbi:BNR repeat-containing protein [Saccharicrinis sp. FJH54]|uniref:BNR repeat-containing protein n=1 Tax=Saccharicrinis sp. FJH54 TaxID=3344665 RepID=UPI0035D4D072